ncbi:MAG: Gfo/Idh/MocA family oxidoreductase [Verrucomicrobia bacterium]|nr:Gfo/Idh/MocA family oxidoreductase [Verrucomicrobiota bacterium]MDA1068768.1 Gfo/Idh/MocA family oxidoreductase [Verrucomicrobiota bacterium]
MSKNTYNTGVIGYGWAATAHINAINGTTQGNVCAVYSSRDLDPVELKAAHGSDIKPYKDVAEMLANPSVDTVSITSYPNQHKEQAIAAARAGKNLIIEKPLALTLADCYAIQEAVDEAGVKACVCFEVRFISQFQTIKKIIGEGLLGELHYAEVDYYHGVGPWYGQYRWNTTKENGGSSLLSAGCHALDALLMCMNDEVVSVTSMNAQSSHEIFSKYEYPTTTVTLVQFKSGKVGKVASVIDCFQPYYFHTHLVGSEGSLLDNKIYSNKLHLRDKAWAELPMALADSGDVADHPYQDQFQAFFDAVDKGEDMPLTSLNESIKTFEVIFAADKSATEGRAVTLEEIRK